MTAALVPGSGVDLDLTRVIIETQRLLLRPIRTEDARAIFPEFNERITRFMVPEPGRDMSVTEAFIESALAKLRSGEDLQLVITDKHTGEFLGCSGLHSRREPLRPELGIWVKESAHGKAFGREAISGLKEWADRSLRYEYLVYPVDRANIASRRIPESLGGEIFRQEVVERPGRAPLDEVIYRILPAPARPL